MRPVLRAPGPKHGSRRTALRPCCRRCCGTRELSARRTGDRRGIPARHWEASAERRPVPRSRTHLEPPACERDAFAHPEQAEAFVRGFRIEAPSVVADLHLEALVC